MRSQANDTNINKYQTKKTSTYCKGTVTDVPQTNGSHSLFLVDYKIYIEYINYKQFLNLMKK